MVLGKQDSGPVLDPYFDISCLWVEHRLQVNIILQVSVLAEILEALL
jgi:hypothetical protein